MHMYDTYISFVCCEVVGMLNCRQLVLARDRISTGLHKLLETNDLVVNMEVSTCIDCHTYIPYSGKLSEIETLTIFASRHENAKV